MSFLRTEKWPNGNSYTLVDYYKCDKCEKEICESSPHYKEEDNNLHLCSDCAYIEGKVKEEWYLKISGRLNDNYKTYIHNKEIILIKKGRRPPWERNENNRYSSEYKKWRNKIFKRDNYTCQKCKQKGGNLNAHHKKSYSDYPDLRLELENGITLCKECHMDEHKGSG